MLDIIYRYDPDHPSLREPRTPGEAKKLLDVTLEGAVG